VLFPNPRNSSAQRAVQSLRSWLTARGVRILGLRQIKDARAVISLGGDGTLLAAARRAAPFDVPVLGINLGRLGFLTATDVQRARPVLKHLVSDRLIVSHRMMLEVLSPKGLTFPIVNDCAIQGAAAGRVVRLSVRVGGEPLGTYVGDGLIVATPTGSTAYSMAAGGPIVCPEIDLILLTPICPHSLSQRPVLIPPDRDVEVRLEPRRLREKLAVSVDGRESFTLSPGERMVLRRMKARLHILSEKGRSFFGVLREKLLWGER
jgi:NAD+ kinase